ncbi:MAG: hypothetical protein QXN34_02335 [Archaeoglobaceae archaeon]
MYSSNSLFKTKISAHFVDAFVAEGEVTSVEGWLTFYDEKEKSWKPLDGELKFYLDGREIGRASSKTGQFKFSFLSPSIGKHRLDIKFKEKGYEPSYKSLEFEVVKIEKKFKIVKFTKIVFILLLLICAAFFISVFLLKRL